jgi:hypothetical protein
MSERISRDRKLGKPKRTKENRKGGRRNAKHSDKIKEEKLEGIFEVSVKIVVLLM